MQSSIAIDRACLAVALTRDAAPQAAATLLDEGSVALLTRLARVRVHAAPMQAAMLCTREHGGTAHLVVRESSPRAGRLYLVLREVGRVLLGSPDVGPAAVLYALCVILNREELEAFGEVWRDRTIEDIRGLSGDVAAEVDAVLPWLDDCLAAVLCIGTREIAVRHLRVRDDAEWAYEVGRLASGKAEWGRAARYYRRAVRLGREYGDWNAVALAWKGMAMMYNTRGNFPSARRYFGRALAVARRYGLRSVLGGTYHDLFTVAIHTGDHVNAYRHGDLAERCYPAGHFRRPALSHDLGFLWMSEGFFDLAQRTFEAALPYFRRDPDRLVVLANIARAAAGTGNRAVYAGTVERIEREFFGGRLVETAAYARLALAQAAVSLGEWEAAEAAASAALAVAEERREGLMILQAESVLDCARRRLAAARAPVRQQRYDDAAGLTERVVASLAYVKV